MKNFIKKSVSAAVLGVMLMPASFAQASTILTQDFGDSSATLLENVAKATSVDFSVDVDVTTDNDQIDQPVTVHIDLDGKTDFERKSAFNFGFVSTDELENIQNAGGSMIMIDDTVYLSEAGGEWYFIELDSATSTESDIDDGVEEIQDVMNDLFDHGVISYQPEWAERVNGTIAVRYAYTVNMERFVDYLVETDRISEAQAEERYELIADVVIGGNLWVDISEMLPVKFTMNIDVNSSTTSYTAIDVSVVFNSFNKAVNISAPTNATNLEDADFSDTEHAVDTAFEMTIASMDTDGDGLTNADEESIWYSNPLSSDTDNDGYPDYTEVINGYDPNGVGKLDSDGDGLTDYAEMTIHWTNRFDSDSDNDSYNDGLEIANGYNPNGPGRW